VTINVQDETGTRRVDFSPKLFTYGKNQIADKIPSDLGFAGFRITYPFYKKAEYDHVIVFAGASYFRAVAKNGVFGLSARGLAADTGLPSGEEFPFFRPKLRRLLALAEVEKKQTSSAIHTYINRCAAPTERTE
jgi:periplasmic glucans biosynthesis protein